MIDPALTVVVALQNARCIAEACIDSLLAQTGVESNTVEIILVDGSQDGTSELINARYPFLAMVRSDDTYSLPKLLGLGVVRARGRLIAITEGHCTFAADWAKTAIDAHKETESPVISGVVEPGCKLTPLDWALYFCDYGQFLLPIQAGPTEDLPGNNIVFKREVLEQGVDFEKVGLWKTFLCRHIMAEGATLLSEPGLFAYYNRQITLMELVQRRYRHGRCFGAMRSEQIQPEHRVLYALTGPLLPWLLLYKLFRRVWPKGRYRRKFLFVLPWSFLAILTWSIGEWWGNLCGPGQSCEWL